MPPLTEPLLGHGDDGHEQGSNPSRILSILPPVPLVPPAGQGALPAASAPAPPPHTVGNGLREDHVHSSDDEQGHGREPHGHGDGGGHGDGHGNGHAHGHSHSHAVLDEDSVEKISAMSVYEVGRRVGTLHDMWRSDPARALKYFTSDTPKEHVLRGLFLPLPKHFTPSLVEPPLSTPKVDGPPFKVGDHVYAPLGPFELLQHERRACEEMGVLAHDHRVWYLCTVESCDGHTCTVSCTDLDKYKHKDKVNFVWRHEDLRYAGTREDASILDHIAHKTGKPALALTPLQKAQFYGLVALGIGLLQVYASVFLDTWCEEQDDAHPHCRARASLKNGLAFTIGIVCLGISVCLYWVVLPGVYRILRGIDPLVAFRCRQMLTSMVLDPLILTLLPNVAGRGEEFVVVAYAAIIMAFMTYTFLLGDVGVIAFGALAGQRFLMTGNLLGVKKSVLVLRERQLFEVAEEIRKKCPVTISKEQLELEMKLFLAHEADNETMQISRDLMLLIAIGMKVEKPDSIRLRNLVVPDVYVHNFLDKPEQCPRKFERADVLIDLFTDTIEVPGVALYPEVERWLQHGSKFFWHTCMKQDQVTQAEVDLRSLGMQGGDGCFTWRPNAAQKWAALECRHDQEHLRRVHVISERRQDLCSSLYAMAIAGNGEECRILLDAQADPNHRDASGVPVLVAACSYKHDDSYKIVDMLLEKRADPSASSCNSGQSALMTVCRKTRVNLATLLLTARAEVNHVAFNGQSALSFAQKGETGVSCSEEKKAKCRELVQLLMDFGATASSSPRKGPQAGAKQEDEPQIIRSTRRKQTVEEVEAIAASEQVDGAVDVDEDRRDVKATRDERIGPSQVQLPRKLPSAACDPGQRAPSPSLPGVADERTAVPGPDLVE